MANKEAPLLTRQRRPAATRFPALRDSTDEFLSTGQLLSGA